MLQLSVSSEISHPRDKATTCVPPGLLAGSVNHDPTTTARGAPR